MHLTSMKSIFEGVNKMIINFYFQTNIEDSKKLYMYLETRLKDEISMQKRKKLEVSTEQVSEGNGN